MAQQILVVEDEPSLRDLLQRLLTARGYHVHAAADGSSALQLAATSPPDLVLLDLVLPDLDGFAVCRALRAHPRLHEVPVIMLTALHETPSKVAGLDIGADDYMTKPFDVRELAARIRARLRGSDDETLALGNLQLLRGRQELTHGTTRVALTGREFALLELFAQHPNQLLRRAALLTDVWGGGAEADSNVLDVYVRRLRRKLASLDATASIRTVRGDGYVFNLPTS